MNSPAQYGAPSNKTLTRTVTLEHKYTTVQQHKQTRMKSIQWCNNTPDRNSIIEWVIWWVWQYKTPKTNGHHIKLKIMVFTMTTQKQSPHQWLNQHLHHNINHTITGANSNTTFTLKSTMKEMDLYYAMGTVHRD